MEHELTFQQVKDQVELPELLLHYGYTLKAGENLGRGKWHVFEGDDKLVVFKGRGNDWMYFNAQDDRDKGSVIDWMKNRVTSGRIAGIEQVPGRNVWQSVNDHFRAYLNLPEAQRPRLELPPLAPTEPGARFQSIYTQDCTPLTDTAYLEGRGISLQTLGSPQFAGRILNQHHTVQREGMPAKTYVNTAFPAYHEDRVVGLELKGEGFKGQAPDSQFTRSLWLSKQPEGKPATHLVVSESAIDALSYAQLHPGERALYASTSGILTQNKVFELKRVVAAENLSGVKSAFDNDVQGHHFDTRLLAGFASEQNPMKVVREHPHLLTVEVTTANAAGIQALTQQLRTYNAHTTEHYYRVSGTEPLPALPPTLRDELITATKGTPSTYHFHVPMGREALSAFNQAAAQHLSFEQKLELVKSQGKDWNQDLKDAQMQAVVRRELGGPGGQHQRPAVPAQAAPAPAAPADPQRVLVVEFRESRDELSQLQTLRANLEKAGLTIDSSRKLLTNGLRELATALDLRYQVDSPKLITISQALDGLGSNARATVQEPAPDAAERRQLAAAQEQVREQQRASQRQIQPGDSPVRDQARQEFVNAAATLTKQLQATEVAGERLAAARLQTVSERLIKQPELRATDRDNLNKVLVTVEKSAFRDSPDVQQLRQAVETLAKPASKQEQSQPQKPESIKFRKSPRL